MSFYFAKVACRLLYVKRPSVEKASIYMNYFDCEGLQLSKTT